MSILLTLIVSSLLLFTFSQFGGRLSARSALLVDCWTIPGY